MMDVLDGSGWSGCGWMQVDGPDAVGVLVLYECVRTEQARTHCTSMYSAVLV